ncbi:uncharacterized protein BJ171DRAFT_474559 [Polychytrium aggregatum]|uniref:uncharacterized protein n=1 Tax=Polychytrium aggregatum TaxID=110093 RepID=UPI0022FE04BB|nr:uncharacterized protein BJ171DRAFT_474559 [Polychytrium aggregatum]KAI9205157.1 hypothetical protein BJ171DRAFT_474559 [Polychytrium aggregatum]
MAAIWPRYGRDMNRSHASTLAVRENIPALGIFRAVAHLIRAIRQLLLRHSRLSMQTEGWKCVIAEPRILPTQIYSALVVVGICGALATKVPSVRRASGRRSHEGKSISQKEHLAPLLLKKQDPAADQEEQPPSPLPPLLLEEYPPLDTDAASSPGSTIEAATLETSKTASDVHGPQIPTSPATVCDQSASVAALNVPAAGDANCSAPITSPAAAIPPPSTPVPLVPSKDITAVPLNSVPVMPITPDSYSDCGRYSDTASNSDTITNTDMGDEVPKTNTPMPRSCSGSVCSDLSALDDSPTSGMPAPTAASKHIRSSRGGRVMRHCVYRTWKKQDDSASINEVLLRLENLSLSTSRVLPPSFISRSKPFDEDAPYIDTDGSLSPRSQLSGPAQDTLNLNELLESLGKLNLQS